MVLGIVIFNITVLLRVLTMNSSCSGMGLAYKTCFSYCCSVAKSCPTLRGPHGLQHTRLPYPLQSLSLLKFISIESVIPSNHLILCHPLLLPSILPSIKVFSNSQFFASCGQIIAAAASASVLPMNILRVDFL